MLLVRLRMLEMQLLEIPSEFLICDTLQGLKKIELEISQFFLN
jgi:hypothetical protein